MCSLDTECSWKAAFHRPVLSGQYFGQIILYVSTKYSSQSSAEQNWFILTLFSGFYRKFCLLFFFSLRVGSLTVSLKQDSFTLCYTTEILS